MDYDVFLCHASGDKPAVRDLAARLQARQLRPWLDETELRPGFPWMPRLLEGLRGSRAIVVCVGASETGPWQQEEVEEALRAVKKDGRPLIPVLLPDAPPGVAFPPFVESRTWVSFRDGWSGAELDRLVWGITGRRPDAAPRVRELPRLPYFFGREKELEAVLGALHPDARTWGALIDGPGGIGKTALAIRAAERAPDDWFDRVVFLTAKTRELTAEGEAPRDDGLRSWRELVAALAEALGEPEVSKLDDPVVLKAATTRLRDARALLVLDNLETLPAPDVLRVFQLLGRLPPGSKAIVTSRRRTDVDARIIRLDTLDPTAAQALIAALAEDRPRLAAATPEEREALYLETGGNPLLLRWLAGQLGRGRCHDVGAALALLRAAPPGNDPLEYVFGDLATSFTEREARVLAALTHFQGPIVTKHVAAVAGMSEPATQTALQDLAFRALVVPDVAEAAWVLAPMVAVYLRRTRPEVVTSTGDVLAERVYALVIENGGDDAWERYGAIEAEWDLVVAGMERLLGGDNTRLQRACDALDFPLIHVGRWEEQEAWFGQAELRAADAGDLWNAGWRAYGAGFAASQRGAFERCLAAVDRAAGHWAVGPPLGREQAIATRLRGLALRGIGRLDEAEAALRESLVERRGRNTRGRDVALVEADLGSINLRRGRYAEARGCYERALAIHRALGARPEVASAISRLAAVAAAELDWPGAEELARQVVAEEAARRDVRAHGLHTLARALSSQGRLADALPFAVEAVEIRRRLNHPSLPAAEATLADIRAKLS